MPASHHSLSLTPLRVLACLALLSVVAAGIAITVILSQSTNPMFSIRREVIVPDLSGMDWQQARAKHHHCTGSEKPEPFRCHPDPAGRRFYRFRRLYPQRSHPAGRYRYSAISCRRHRTGSRGLYYPYRCPCRTRPVPPGAVPAGHVGRRSAPPPCHCGAAAHSDPLQSDRGHHHRAGSPARHPFAPQRPCAACYKIVCRTIVKNKFSLEKSKKILDFPLPYAIINEHLRLGTPPTACELNKMRW